MKTNIPKIGAIVLAVGICIWSTALPAQTTTSSVTTTRGAVTEYVPGQAVAVRTETSAAPLRYVVTKQTTVVDESGAPVALERITPGSPVSIQYSGTGDRLVASRIIVQKSTSASAPVTTTTTTAPVTTAPVVTEQQTTTSTTRALTHDEKHAIKEEREHKKRALKKEIEHEKDALEKEKDKLDDD